MTRMRLLVVGVALGVLSGCASMNTPSSTLIDEKPVIRIGSKDKPSEDYILYIPAKTTFPVNMVVSGNVFASAPTLNSTAILKEDLYLYQYWASRDGKSWVHTHAMFNSDVSIGVNYSGGKGEIKLDYAE